MAKYDVAHTCGHTETHQLIGAETERQRKLTWLATTDCRACYDARKATEAAAKSAELPALEGSAKQIAWADRIRAKLLDVIAAEEAHLIGAAKAEHVVAAVRTNATRIRNQTKASYWIDRDAKGDMHGRLRKLVIDALAPKPE